MMSFFNNEMNFVNDSIVARAPETKGNQNYIHAKRKKKKRGIHKKMYEKEI